MTQLNKEKAEMASKDADILDDLSAWLRAYEFEVCACGRDGDIEKVKIQDSARVAIKALVNYL